MTAAIAFRECRATTLPPYAPGASSSSAKSSRPCGQSPRPLAELMCPRGAPLDRAPRRQERDAADEGPQKHPPDDVAADLVRLAGAAQVAEDRHEEAPGDEDERDERRREAEDGEVVRLQPHAE